MDALGRTMRTMSAGACRAVLFALVWMSGCGGGGGSGTSPSSSAPPPSTIPPPVTPVNHSPVLAHAAADQQLITQHAFSFDVSQGGTAVSDADGDPLTYQIRVNGGPTGFSFPPGVSASGPIIAGTFTSPGVWQIEVAVDDNRGGNTVSYSLLLRVAANAAPSLIHPHSPKLVALAQSIDIDVTQGGTTFEDPDGDALQYVVTMRGNPQGLSVSGTHVSGSLTAVGAVQVTATASDPYGAASSHAFLIAAPAPESTAVPQLPATAYAYRDEELPLPFVHRLASQVRTLIWDMQPADNRTTNEGATLGRVLFYDKRLSITNTVACASCHLQSHGFASPQRFDTGVLGVPLARNSMALANARYNPPEAWFSDMRVGPDLRALIFVPIDNHDELGMALSSVEAKLAQVSFYPSLFNAAFGTPEVTRERIAAALAQFLQALIAYRSKADLALDPMTNIPPTPEAILTAQELQGLQVYRDHCAICHEEQAGVNIWHANNGLDETPSDIGTVVPAHQRNGALGVFRAASLRNIAVSGPYMHDGRFTTLRQVIEQYDHDIKFSEHLDGILRDGSGAVRLNLSVAQKDALESFLNTFTDNAFLTDPRLSDPFAP
jgi:cytochrome c peroxidase